MRSLLVLFVVITGAALLATGCQHDARFALATSPLIQHEHYDAYRVEPTTVVVRNIENLSRQKKEESDWSCMEKLVKQRSDTLNQIISRDSSQGVNQPLPAVIKVTILPANEPDSIHVSAISIFDFDGSLNCQTVHPAIDEVDMPL